MIIDNMAPGNGRKVKEDGASYNTADGAANSMGVYNFDRISDTDAHTPPAGMVYTALKAINGPVVLAGLTADPNTPITGAVAGDTIRDGDTLLGRFVSVTRSLTSTGVIYAIKGK